MTNILKQVSYDLKGKEFKISTDEKFVKEDKIWELFLS